MIQFENKALVFASALSNVYKKPEERDDLQELKLEEESLTEDFTAMLWGLMVFYKHISGKEVDILGFISLLNRLAFQHLTGEKEESAKDYSHAAARIFIALENCKVPITWHEINRPKLKQVVAQELKHLDEKDQIQ